MLFSTAICLQKEKLLLFTGDTTALSKTRAPNSLNLAVTAQGEHVSFVSNC